MQNFIIGPLDRLSDKRKIIFLSIFCLISIGISSCKTDSKEEEQKPSPRPVTYMLLKKSDPSQITRATGSVESWKVEKVGFQVDGRVVSVVEPGVEILGNIFDENGAVLTNGTILAELKDERHALRLKEARARVAARQAEMDRRDKEYKRQANLLREGATSQKKFEKAESEFRGAGARLREAQRLARQTEVDLRDTRLYSPYHGQVSKVHVIPGAYVERGQPVVSVQMMDPMKVEIAVSPRTDRLINYGDLLKVYVDGYEEPIEGTVWFKDSVADAATRTFMVTLLVRNHRIEVGVPDELKAKNFHRTEDIMRLDEERAGGEPIYYANQRSINKDEQGFFLWKVEGLKSSDLYTDFNPIFTVRKVRVKLGESVIRLLQSYTFRELENFGDLDPTEDLVTGDMPEGVENGDSVLLSRKRWLVRPGELVHVDLSGGKGTGGYHVPAHSIIEDGNSQYVYMVSRDTSEGEYAKRVSVTVDEGIGNFRRIEPVSGGVLNEGMKLIVDGAHYLVDGDLINAFDEVEVSP